MGLHAKMNNGLYIFGFDAVNLQRMKNKEPIVLHLDQMQGCDRLVLMYGDTLDDIKAEIEHVTGLKMPDENYVAPKE